MSNNKRLIAEIINGEQILMTIDDNMSYCEFGALDRGNITDVVNWGIYANRGSISFIDNVGYFNNDNVNSLELKSAVVKFYLAKKTKTHIATFKVDSCAFDDETRQVDIELISKLTELQTKKANSVAFPFREKSCKYLIGLSNDLTEAEAGTYPWYYPSFGLTEGEENKNLEKTIIYCPYLPKERAWNRISNICQSTMYRVIEGENGKPIITGSFPNKDAIIVKPNNIIGISNQAFVRIPNTSIDVINRTKYSTKKVDQISKHFDISYNEFGLPISISNCEYSFGSNNDATIKCFFDTSYKIYSCEMSHIVSTIEIKNKLVENASASYSTEEWGAAASVRGNEKTSLNFEYQISNLIQDFGDSERRVKSVDVDFYLTYFVDDGTSEQTNITDATESDSIVKISSNDLIQTESYYIVDSEKIPLATKILEEVRRRYSKGVECFEIECLFNDYWYENGIKAFYSEDLSSHFKHYDVIIPYVKKEGQTVPLRVNKDGTPKKFRIIGISYSYDGLLKQKLHVQEERYDDD